MPRRQRRKQSRKGRSRYITVIENFTFTTQTGTQSNITAAVLTNRPPRSNFRLQWVEIQACTYIPGSGDPTFSPAAVQITLNAENDGECVAVSRPIVLGPQPKTLRVRQPPSSDWNAYNLTSTSILGSIRAICVGPPPTASHNVYIRGMCRVGLRCQEEVSAIVCPTVVTHLGETSEESFEQVINPAE